MSVQNPVDRTALAAGEALGSNAVSFSMSVAGRTDRGQRRADNEDNFFYLVSSDGGTGIFAVADGMGGQHSGEVASALTIQTLRDELAPLILDGSSGGGETQLHARLAASGNQSLQDVVRDAINQCNDRILSHAKEHPEAQGLGSTLTIAVVTGSLAIIGNIGDSRTYLLRDRALESLTRDHSLVAHLAAIGQIAPEDVYSHPQRSYIYRALGTEEAQADIIIERLQSGDFLLLCSDGLWEMVRDETICQAITEAENPDDAVVRLVALANANGGEDNISALLVRVS